MIASFSKNRKIVLIALPLLMGIMAISFQNCGSSNFESSRNESLTCIGPEDSREYSIGYIASINQYKEFHVQYNGEPSGITAQWFIDDEVKNHGELTEVFGYDFNPATSCFDYVVKAWFEVCGKSLVTETTVTIGACNN